MAKALSKTLLDVIFASIEAKIAYSDFMRQNEELIAAELGNGTNASTQEALADYRELKQIGTERSLAMALNRLKGWAKGSIDDKIYRPAVQAFAKADKTEYQQIKNRLYGVAAGPSRNDIFADGVYQLFPGQPIDGILASVSDMLAFVAANAKQYDKFRATHHEAAGVHPAALKS